MKLEVIVAGVAEETWFRGQRDERQVYVMNCLDRQAFLGQKMKLTFDFVPDEADAESLDIPALDGATLALSVSEIKAASGGRLKFKGKVDLSSVPKAALRNGNGKPSGNGGSQAKVSSNA